MEILVAGERKLNSSFTKLDSELVISSNANIVLSERPEQTEKQCCANTQYSRRERVEIVKIPSSVH